MISPYPVKPSAVLLFKLTLAGFLADTCQGELQCNVLKKFLEMELEQLMFCVKVIDKKQTKVLSHYIYQC